MILYNKLRQLLLEADFSEIEAEVYIELLKKPSQNLFELVIRTKLSKSSVYRAFEKLQSYKMVEKTEDGIRALSLKTVVADLHAQLRKIGKTADKIKHIAPYLHAKPDTFERFETLYTEDQIRDAYLFMAEQDYDVNLDFGDFENFIPTIGGMYTAYKFQNNRVKHATNHAICTTYGPNTGYFCTREAKTKYKNFVKRIDNGIQGSFTIFSDRSDYVLFNNFSGDEDSCGADGSVVGQYSVLVKSKAVADSQRKQFDAFSQEGGNE